MSWLPQRLTDPRPPHSFMPEPVDFVGQQAGYAEDALKAAFREVFAATPTVQSAYLARVYRGNAPKQSVALCIRSSIGVDDKLEDRLAAIFRSRFQPDQRLDFLFLLAEEEWRVREVCPPFFQRHA
jgi:type III secretion system (T3SS) SseB-like protein